MTQSTEQERADFESAFIEQKLMERGISGDVAEKDLREVFLWKDAAGCYDHKETKAALWGWQAARRAPVVPQDPMDWPLPCDVTVGHGTVGKGVKLRTLVLRMKALYKIATGNDADEVDARTPEQRATLLAAFQSQIAAAPQPPEAEGLMSEKRTTKPDAAPVQLPEPMAYQAEHQSGEWINRDAPTIPSTGIYTGRIRSLYTEHQVRQLLATHNIAP